ncbi:MAG: DUF1015 domain-containing protein [Nitrospirae bacterium]|nr:DUF1015 domain-containing protein [Nitrospirota bacterium]
MAEILPFRGIRYDEGRGDALERVIAPPYDVISPQDRDRFYGESDYNVIRLILGKEFPEDDERNNKYSRAADFFQEWLKKGVLKEDEEPAIYVYEQEYFHKGKKKSRRGFLALLKLEDFGSGGIFPHEETLSQPKKDRLNLLRVCWANLGPIFTLYSDPNRIVEGLLGEEKETLIDVEDTKGERHKIKAITSSEKIEGLKQFLKNKEIYLADGHHRYETALNFRNEMRQKSSSYTGGEAYNYLMTYFTNMDDEGLLILPAHRLISKLKDLNIDELIKKLSPCFEITLLGPGEDELRKLLSSLEKRNEGEHLFGMYGAGRLYLLRLRDEAILHKLMGGDKSWDWKKLDVTILHQIILNGGLSGGKRLDEGKVDYLTDAEEAFRLVGRGKYQLAFFLNPPKVSQMRDIARVGEKMPGKATYFYPKLLTGLLMRKM